MIRRALVLGLFALALVAPASALAVERTVTVEATATIKVPDDTASVGLGVSLERGSRGAALQATSAKLRAVIAAVQTIPGVGAGDIQTGRVSVREPEDGRYRASEGISVILHEPARAGELIQAAIAAGATGIRGPSYFVGNEDAAFANALAAAFQKAKAKAATLATQAGATLGPALTINEGGRPEIVPYPAAEAAPKSKEDCTATSQPAAPQPAPAAKRAQDSVCVATPPPTKPGTSTVTATVGVVFSLL